jgi:hypothetical protein
MTFVWASLRITHRHRIGGAGKSLNTVRLLLGSSPESSKSSGELVDEKGAAKKIKALGSYFWEGRSYNSTALLDLIRTVAPRENWTSSSSGSKWTAASWSRLLRAADGLAVPTAFTWPVDLDSEELIGQTGFHCEQLFKSRLEEAECSVLSLLTLW